MASQGWAGALSAGRQDAYPTVQRIESRDRGWRQGGGGWDGGEAEARAMAGRLERRAGD